MTTRTLLSIDGGGIRGIIPATVIAAIESEAGKPASDLFDIMAGTSTGGIVALGLSVPDGGRPKFSARQIVDLYVQRGRRIFSRSFGHALLNFAGLFYPKYSAEGIEAVLQEYFGLSRLREARTSVVVTAYDIETQKRGACLFRSWAPKPEMPDNPYVWEVARSTSAAPTYFPPLPLPAPGLNRTFVDGGVYANNPALVSYIEATTFGYADDEWLVVSIGTGDPSQPMPYRDASRWGKLTWAPRLIDIQIDGQVDTVDGEMQELLSRRHHKYVRLQAHNLDLRHQELDDTTKSTLDALVGYGDKVVDEAKQSGQFARLVKSLLDAYGPRQGRSWIRARNEAPPHRPEPAAPAPTKAPN
jgi:predicted acylesterase/phospholipase RssA